MNSMPKFVASRTLDKAEWNATLIKGDLGAEEAGLRQGDDPLVGAAARVGRNGEGVRLSLARFPAVPHRDGHPQLPA